jgi:hypothetical protein
LTVTFDDVLNVFKRYPEFHGDAFMAMSDEEANGTNGA